MSACFRHTDERFAGAIAKDVDERCWLHHTNDYIISDWFQIGALNDAMWLSHPKTYNVSSSSMHGRAQNRSNSIIASIIGRNYILYGNYDLCE
jgi:hypothetical protein